MLFGRQKCLLALLDALGGKVGNLDFQKMLFLYCQEAGEKPPYDFVPFRFGGFSFTSYADKRRLIERNLLADEERTWKLTPTGKASGSIAPSVRLRMDAFVRRYAGLRGDSLVAATYRRYPYYAIRSEMAERVLAGDAAALLAIAAKRPQAAKAGLCTIGYEGHTLESYLNRLIRHGVNTLCDVRRNPLSRKSGFSKGKLSNACVGVGIRYEHLPELGIASEHRQSLETQADYDALFDKYERESLQGQRRALEQIRERVQAGACVALTCYERLPAQCHRNCIAKALQREFGSAFAAKHL